MWQMEIRSLRTDDTSHRLKQTVKHTVYRINEEEEEQ